jgi:hypothetical protein
LNDPKALIVGAGIDISEDLTRGLKAITDSKIRGGIYI